MSRTAPRIPLRRRLFAGVAVIALLAPVAGVAEPTREAAATVVLFNAADPDSTALAKYYAGRREIPADNLIGLACASTEEIGRDEYLATIAGPVRAHLLAKGLWTADPASGRVIAAAGRFAAIIRGVPLKIRPDPNIAPNRAQPDPIGSRNEASVDSELAALAAVGASPAGVLPNPYFRRFTPVLDLSTEPGLLMVARLDGPDPITVRGMIDDAISAERDGLWGWGYIDSRGIKSGAYAEGDDWLRALLSEMRLKGIPSLMDSSEQTLPDGFPVTDAAVYYGWYADAVNGPFADPLMKFRTGAIAVHIHSFSAATLRSATANWCGPLLARGAAATVGNVYEPYLALTHDLSILQDRLMEGFTFAESASMAMQVVSWMNVAVGDPLYKPYAVWFQGPAPAGPAKLSSWEQYRKIVLAANGDVVAAAKQLRAAADASDNSMFLEALAAAQLDAGDQDGALRSVRAAIAIETRTPEKFRLGLEECALLCASGDKRGAGKVLSRMASGQIPARSRTLLGSLYENMNPSTPGPTPKMR